MQNDFDRILSEWRVLNGTETKFNEIISDETEVQMCWKQSLEICMDMIVIRNRIKLDHMLEMLVVKKKYINET